MAGYFGHDAILEEEIKILKRKLVEAEAKLKTARAEVFEEAAKMVVGLGPRVMFEEKAKAAREGLR